MDTRSAESSRRSLFDLETGCISTSVWFEEPVAADLADCWRGDQDWLSIKEKINTFRHDSRVLVTESEERELAVLGRRVRGEIFFARTWILVEGPSEHLLLHALGRALGCDLDQHGISVIDFQNSGNAAIYAALADAFGITWLMATDGDPESMRFRSQLLKRGYTADDLTNRFSTLLPPNDLEKQLIADGHENLLREILVEMGISSAARCLTHIVLNLMRKRKVAYMTKLSRRVEADPLLAAQMPSRLSQLFGISKHHASKCHARGRTCQAQLDPADRS
jgi:putative ATP-dependent endonuclease of OLD family